MDDFGFPIEAYIIIDNCAISSLCTYYCETNKKLSIHDMEKKVCEDLTVIFNAIRRNAISHKIITSQLVQAEFKPEKGNLPVPIVHLSHFCNILKSHIHNEIEVLEVTKKPIDRVRTITGFSPKFGVNLSRFSDSDLSLVILALGIIRKFNNLAYILTQDQDLLKFISCFNSVPNIGNIYTNSHKLHGLHCLGYLNRVHQECILPTELIKDLYSEFALREMNRVLNPKPGSPDIYLPGSSKGGMILDSFNRLRDAINESRKIKLLKQQGLTGSV